MFTIKQTPKSRCDTCSYGHRIVTGDIEIRRCLRSPDAPIRVGIVTECDEFDFKYASEPWGMKEAAWILETKRGAVIGFLSPEERKKKENSTP